MESILLEKIGLFSNKISKDDLKPGDHIYSWRNAYIYSHHGIYIGDGKVIHFTRGGGLEIGTGTFLDKLIVSSITNHGGDNPCPNCGGKHSNTHGVISSCLDCFLSGGDLLRFEYSVSPALFMSKLRGGTCTTAASDPSEEVISRAEFLLLRNGYVLGRSGQANSVSAAACVARMVSPWASNAIRLCSDVGMRKDAAKVPVESLVARSAKES
ncbi:hypothetical protein Bca101_000825 [Brassica carinata]